MDNALSNLTLRVRLAATLPAEVKEALAIIGAQPEAACVTE
jgi:hypothetical protein